MPNQTDRQHIANKENTSIEGEFYSGKDMFDLEKERIKSADKRTEIARLAIEANDAADKRQFDYHIQKLNHDIEFKNQQAKVSAKLLYGIGLVSTAFAALLIYPCAAKVSGIKSSFEAVIHRRLQSGMMSN
jgi:hypothetical protein